MPSRKDASQSSKSELQPLTEDEVRNDLSNSSSSGTSSISPPSSSSLQIDSSNSFKIKYWKQHPYAVGCVEPTWTTDEEKSNDSQYNDEETNTTVAHTPCSCSNSSSEEVDPTCGCLLLSRHICGRFGRKRIGNMVLMKEGTIVDDGNEQEGRLPRRRIDCVVGPYWPMLCFVTFPLILFVSALTASKAVFVHGSNPLMMFVWSCLTFGLCFSLYSVATSDPGILPKHTTPPDGSNNRTWFWNDRAQSFIPRGAYFDPDCAVVVVDFDHTCPWTGTAIGKGNMPYFQAFIVMLFICLIMDVILLTSSSIS
jgi:hypothetical protein